MPRPNVVVAASDRPPHLFVDSVATGQPRQLTASRWAGFMPQWAPDGRRIAFRRERAGVTPGAVERGH